MHFTPLFLSFVATTFAMPTGETPSNLNDVTQYIEIPGSFFRQLRGMPSGRFPVFSSSSHAACRKAVEDFESGYHAKTLCKVPEKNWPKVKLTSVTLSYNAFWVNPENIDRGASYECDIYSGYKSCPQDVLATYLAGFHEMKCSMDKTKPYIIDGHDPSISHVLCLEAAEVYRALKAQAITSGQMRKDGKIEMGMLTSAVVNEKSVGQEQAKRILVFDVKGASSSGK